MNYCLLWLTLDMFSFLLHNTNLYSRTELMKIMSHYKEVTEPVKSSCVTSTPPIGIVLFSCGDYYVSL